MSQSSSLLAALTSVLRLIDNAASLGNIRSGTTLHHARQVAERARRGQLGQVPWTPFKPAEVFAVNRAMIAFYKQHASVPLSDEEAAEEIMAASGRLFVNSRYQVNVIDHPDDTVHLSIKRIDQAPIHDWRDLQRIKNELLGPQCEAVELYPAVSRLVDSANQYHLWGKRDSVQFPFGFDESFSLEGDRAGAAQRPKED